MLCPICTDPLRSECLTFIDSIAYCSACAHHAHIGLHLATARALRDLVNAGCILTTHNLNFYSPLTRRRLAAHLYVGTVCGSNVNQSGSTPRTNVPGFDPAQWDGTDIGEERDQT